MKEALRVGLVGCGGMGHEHLKIMARLPGAQIVGVCDHRPERARRMSEAHRLPCWTDYAAFLEEACPQAVHICSPTGLHAVQGIAAAERGIHVLCEKPLDIDLEKVDRLIAVCDAQGVCLGAIFQKRASRAAQKVQQAIAGGGMGRIIACKVSVKGWRSPATQYM